MKNENKTEIKIIQEKPKSWLSSIADLINQDSNETITNKRIRWNFL